MSAFYWLLNACALRDVWSPGLYTVPELHTKEHRERVEFTVTFWYLCEVMVWITISSPLSTYWPIWLWSANCTCSLYVNANFTLKFLRPQGSGPLDVLPTPDEDQADMWTQDVNHFKCRRLYLNNNLSHGLHLRQFKVYFCSQFLRTETTQRQDINDDINNNYWNIAPQIEWLISQQIHSNKCVLMSAVCHSTQSGPGPGCTDGKRGTDIFSAPSRNLFKYLWKIWLANQEKTRQAGRVWQCISYVPCLKNVQEADTSHKVVLFVCSLT